VKTAWTLLTNYTCFFVAVNARFARFEELFERKLKEVELLYEIERMKIPPEILHSKLSVQASVSIFLKVYCNGLCRCVGCIS
jgi:hypothetical protein